MFDRYGSAIEAGARCGHFHRFDTVPVNERRTSHQGCCRH